MSEGKEKYLCLENLAKLITKKGALCCLLGNAAPPSVGTLAVPGGKAGHHP
jgi:hypothetical protein